MKGRLFRNSLLALCAAIVAAAGAQTTTMENGAAENKAEQVVVLTTLQATFSIASALSVDTAIKVENVPPQGRPLSTQRDYFERNPDQLAPLFQGADAVVTMGKLWQEDAFYTAARAYNIHIVPIDATQPWSATLPGVSVIRAPDTTPPWAERLDAPSSGRLSIHFWHNPTNAIRAAGIIAADFQALDPSHRDRIKANLDGLVQSILAVKHRYELQLAQIDDVSLFALTDEFDYLFNDMGLFVDGYFVKQDIDWTEQDLTALENHLRKRQLKVVVHKWQPSESIQQAIHRAGAQLVVLNTMDPGLVQDKQLQSSGYLTLLQENLQALVDAYITH